MLRIEDIDTPRCRPEHADRIVETLKALGFCWDGPVIYQSQRLDRYRQIFDQLKADKRVFPCACSRAELKRAQASEGEVLYPGTCRPGLPQGIRARTWRFQVEDRQEAFEDRLCGHQQQNPAEQCGDVVVLRADGLFAYQLVVVIDDMDQGVTDIVRGVDLLSSTGRQLQLQRSLNAPVPRYLHLPLLCDSRGYKLSKQTGATEIDWETAPQDCLNAALLALGQPPQIGTPKQMLVAAADCWRPGQIPRESLPQK